MRLLRGVFSSFFIIFIFSGCAQGGSGGLFSAGDSSKPMDPAQFIIHTVFFLLSMLCVYWMLVLKPQQDEQRNREAFLDGLKKQDDVFTKGGILAKVVSVGADDVTIEVAQNVRIKVLPTHVFPVAKRKDDKKM